MTIRISLIILLVIISSLSLVVFFNCRKHLKTEHRDISTLIAVQTIFRHGDRTSATSYPNDPYRNFTFPPFGRAQLTLKGKQNALNLGRHLRALYGEFLGEIFVPSMLHSYSSENYRAQNTLQCVHAGLFPPTVQSEMLESYLFWQPIAYQTIPVKEDIILATQARLAKELPVTKNLTLEQREDFKILSEISGKQIKTTHDIFDVQNAIQTQMEYGLERPKWCDDFWWKLLKKYTGEFFKDLVDFKLPTFGSGLTELITNNTRALISGKRKEKMILYSGHEINIYVLLAVMQSFHGEYVDYCASITFELHKINGTYGFKIYFRNGNTESVALRLPNVNPIIDDFNPFSKFVEFTKWVYGKRIMY